MFLIPRLPEDLWYRLDLKRTGLVIIGSSLILAAFWLDRSVAWLLIMIPVTVGLRTFMRPHRVIRALDAPRLIPATEAQLSSDTYVLATEIEGQHRAWPEEILIAHHLIHDWVGKMPVLATW
jgi:hypothetical protein